MFDGYLSFGGIELINAARTTAYIQNMLPGFPLVRRTSLYDTLPTALGDEPYRSPFLDQADWVETKGDDGPSIRNPSHGFYGLYPLEITGIGDSTMSAEVVEGILDGGAVNSERDSTREIRVRGLLVGNSELAVEAGLTWLRNALRTNSCGMHGDLCGYHDLRYFLAAPDVCDPLWADGFNQGDTFSMGTLNVETSPLIYSHGDEGQPHRYEWQFPGQDIDGAKIRWGALAFDGGEVLESYGPLYLRRSNFILNPSFKLTANRWTATGGTVSRIDLGGAQFGRFNQDSPLTYRSNWLPDPSFENGDPNDRGWRGSGDLTAPTDGTAPQGTKVVVVPGAPGGNWIEASMLGPYDDGVTGVLSFWKRGPEDLALTVTDNTGATVFTYTWTGLTNAWARVSVAGVPMKRDYVVRISQTTANEMRLDGFLLEVGAGPAGTYFDGGTTAGGGWTYYYAPNASGPSRARSGTFSSFSVVSATTDAPFGPAVLSLSMRSVEATPSVLVELIDTLDNVVGSLIVQPGPNWQRYALGVGYGRQVRARFTSSTGYFDVDQVMLEAGNDVNDYFDGNSVGPTGYVVTWAGGPDDSASRMTWTGNTEIERRDNWRPFLELTEGSLSAVDLAGAWSTEIGMQYQLEPYDRSYHRVSCTVGVKKITRHAVDVGAATEVDFVLTAATPHAFSTIAENMGGPQGAPVYVSDEVVNMVATNPRSTALTTGWSLIGTGTGPTAGGDSGGVYVSTTTSGQAGNAFGMSRSFNVGTGPTDLAPDTTYTLGIEVRCFLSPATILNSRITVSGSGKAGGSTVQTQSTDWVDNRRYITFKTAASGTVTVAVTNATSTPSGTTIVAARFVAVTFGDARYAYFDGDTADTSAYDYAWDGVAAASTSRRTIHVATQNPLVDPDLPVVPTPPSPPTIPDLAIDEQIDWVRYFLEIPAGNVAAWAGTVPTLELSTATSAVRQVRVRFYPNPYGWDREDIDPTSYCGEFILSYLPANSVVTVSGTTQEAWAQVAGGEPQSANHLLYGTGGLPMDWPELSCAVPYVMTVDIPQPTSFVNLDLDLTLNRRE